MTPMTPVEALESLAHLSKVCRSALPIARAQAAVCEVVRAWTKYDASAGDVYRALDALDAAEQAVPPAERGEEQR